MAVDYEDVSIFTLSEDREERLLTTQTECTFMWTTKAGEPVGVIMSFVYRNGSFWLTATKQRARIPAITRDPRVAICISSRGTDIGISQSLTYKGIAHLHDDDDTKAWFYPELSEAVRPDNKSQSEAFAAHLDSPARVIIEIKPTKRIGFDSEAMFEGSAAGKTKTQMKSTAKTAD